MQTSNGTRPLCNHARMSDLLLCSCVTSTNFVLVLPTTLLLPIQCVCGGLEANELATLLSELQLSAFIFSTEFLWTCQTTPKTCPSRCTGLHRYLLIKSDREIFTLSVKEFSGIKISGVRSSTIFFFFFYG